MSLIALVNEMVGYPKRNWTRKQYTDWRRDLRKVRSSLRLCYFNVFTRTDHLPGLVEALGELNERVDKFVTQPEDRAFKECFLNCETETRVLTYQRNSVLGDSDYIRQQVIGPTYCFQHYLVAECLAQPAE